jgi:hypothetical protein
MREVTPGDLVFSFVDTRVIALGIVASYCYESPKPAEFGGVGLNWEAIGWRVRVNFASQQGSLRLDQKKLFFFNNCSDFVTNLWFPTRKKSKC